MRCLGIDYGTKRIGLAHGDEIGVATPLPAFLGGPGEGAWTKIGEIMSGLRASIPSRVGPLEVVAVSDFLARTRTVKGEAPAPLELPASNVLSFELEGGSRVIARPSGTEPKLRLMRGFIVGQAGDERRRCAESGQVLGDDRSAAVEVFLVDAAKRHHWPFAGHAGCIAEVIAVQDVIADHDHALVAETVQHLLERMGAQIVSPAKPAEFFILEWVGPLNAADQCGGRIDDVV